MQDYPTGILKLYEDAIEALVACKISREIVDFRRGYKKPRRPTAAFSSFLINRQFGDWSETLLRKEINNRLNGFKALKYGAGGRLIVGHPDFPKMFDEYHKELNEIGKRPDLIFFKEETVKKFNLLDDVSEWESKPLIEIAKLAVSAIEVRSSKYYASMYEKKKGKKQSYTPKLEDIPLLTHWVAVHGVPCFYAQVFMDEAHIISFEKILQIIQKTGNQYIGRMEKNQRKSTFYIPVSEGVLIGKVTENP